MGAEAGNGIAGGLAEVRATDGVPGEVRARIISHSRIARFLLVLALWGPWWGGGKWGAAARWPPPAWRRRRESGRTRAGAWRRPFRGGRPAEGPDFGPQVGLTWYQATPGEGGAQARARASAAGLGQRFPPSEPPAVRRRPPGGGGGRERVLSSTLDYNPKS